MSATPTTLVIAAHPDDEALGCGGTIKKLTSQGETVKILFLCDGVTSRISPNTDQDELYHRQHMARKAANLMGADEPEFLTFADNQLDATPLLDVIQKIEGVIQTYKPHTVYTHHHGDLNLDHSRVAKAVLTACRPQPGFCVQKIYGFEVPSSTEWSFPNTEHPFTPQRFVALDEACVSAKFAALEAYDFEMRPFPHSRSYDAIKALVTWRGASIGSPAAEAFTVIRDIEK